jgi:5-methyltetrahydrofolate--homocysteine methyltransferase
VQAAGLREKVKVVIGGAPVTENYARQIGADAFAPDASSAVRTVRQLVG